MISEKVKLDRLSRGRSWSCSWMKGSDVEHSSFGSTSTGRGGETSSSGLRRSSGNRIRFDLATFPQVSLFAMPLFLVEDAVDDADREKDGE